MKIATIRERVDGLGTANTELLREGKKTHHVKSGLNMH